ncbi:MAG: aminodeoxychorismate synthase component I, partial [Planctomicrobium sp.]|nr:aminodeoxychorismate synthase component I [Planctomicrobium sp.]
AKSSSVQILTNKNKLPANEIVSTNFSYNEYQAAVQKVVDYIYEGDVFQANLSQRFIADSCANPLDVYRALRQHNPAPFAGLIKFADWAVHSSSPERFVQKAGDQVWTRPIKGTRQRRPVPEADLYTRDELRESQKDQAENVMIVDLLRNDLSRVCQSGLIRVPELCSIEAYETVTHLVSEVTGQLQPETTFWDVLRASFPGGSITGAPKIRAMEIITELEKVARGPYCGSMFYLGFDGTADSNILIRTIIQRGDKLAFPAGGGIVSQSSPKAEYEETLHKSEGMRTAIRSFH